MIHPQSHTSIKPRWQRIPWWLWIVVIDVYLLVATEIVAYDISIPAKGALFYPFDLSVEMNLGVWWSGICLFAAGLLAYENFCNGEGSERSAWLVLSALLVGLSYDEVGSIHERVGKDSVMGVWSALGVWSGKLPFIVIGFAFFVFAFVRLIKREQTRRSAIAILSGFVLFGSVLLQEYLEWNIDWAPWVRGIRVGVEEGTELLGALLCLWGMVSLRKKGSQNASLETIIANPLRMKYILAVIFVGLLIHGAVILILGRNINITGLGNPAVWYPSALFFVIFCTGFWIAMNAPKTMHTFWVVLAWIFFLSSAAAVYNPLLLVPIIRKLPIELLSTMYFYGFSVGILVIMLLLYRIYPRKLFAEGPLIVAAIIVLLTTNYIIRSELFQMFIFGIFVFLMSRSVLVRLPVMQEKVTAQ
jgi:voltage-gated potassium channel Kch